MKDIILTGFEPFGPYKFNPVEESTKYFDGKQLGEYKIKGLVLPCTYYGGFNVLKQAMKEINPFAIVSSGLASRVRGIRFETTGRNSMNGKYPDANGFNPNGNSLIEGEKEFFYSSVDNSYLAHLVEEQGIPTEVSTDAEGFICNALLYLTSQHIHVRNLDTKNVFFHTPWTSNYKEKINLESGKIMISRDDLHTSIATIVENIEK